MNKIKKSKAAIIIGASAAAVALACGIFTGVSAFYIETADADYNAIAGSVIVKSDEISISNIGNFNPGDENPEKDLPSDHRAGTEHKLSYTIHNEGNKSITTRSVIDLTVTGTDGKILDPSVFTLYQTKNGETTPVKIEDAKDSNIRDNVVIGERMYVLKDGSVVSSKPSDADDIKSLRYMILGPNLNGVGDGAEIEAKSNGPEDTAVYAVALDFTTPDEYQGASLDFDVNIQAMQYRNTNSGDWKTVYQDHIRS